ncbi:growth factor receptor-bound protein 10-like isoform X2 [Cimex lectularius]|nr:growth factor receptor-bound protein 10-like isoform X2 [Cimex lectularius]XP_014250738.1 growth factor receptor-bound protein 10-like isoform X2 [Cimex lectularius]XP_014250739.1 growth factor receptor-bound protein 10-like isoform X2 [Cimex lectularius]
MGMKLRCFEGSGGTNSYFLLENLAENKDSSTEKQEELQFFNDDGSYTGIIVEKDLRAIDLCLLLAVKNRVTKDFSWSIVEHWVETGIERVLEDHEDVLAVHRQTEPGAKKYIFRRIQNKYDFFTEPESFFPADMVDLRNCDEAVSTSTSEDLTAALEHLLTNSEQCPSIFSQVCIQSQANKNNWVKTFLLLKDNKLFMSSKVHVVAKFLRHWKSRDNCYRSLDEQDPNRIYLEDDKSHQELQLLADLKEYEVYTCLNAKNQLRAPTEFGICLRKSSEEDFSSGIVFSCECQRDRTCWLTAMRLAKYGKQLRENYRAFKEKQEQINASQYSSYTVPNESVRSRVAMDFTGSVGRIVEDPNEAKAIAVSEGIAWRRRWRPQAKNATSRRPCSTNDMVHLGQPWFHKTMTREQATALVSAHGNQDGVFLVRESRSNQGCFVLTFKCSGKVIHMPILPITDPVRDALCFTLDNGVTKFYDLLQLIEFYQLNAGCLPARLTHYLEKSVPDEN